MALRMCVGVSRIQEEKRRLKPIAHRAAAVVFGMEVRNCLHSTLNPLGFFLSPAPGRATLGRRGISGATVVFSRGARLRFAIRAAIKGYTTRTSTVPMQQFLEEFLPRTRPGR